MSIQYQVVWALLVSELISLAFLILPFPIQWKSKTIKWLRNNSRLETVWYALKVLFVFVLILYLDSTSRAIAIHTQKNAYSNLVLEREYPIVKDSHVEQQLNLKMFYSQRNMYLTGFTLLLAIILRSFIKLALREVDLIEKVSQLTSHMQFMQCIPETIAEEDEGEEDEIQLCNINTIAGTVTQRHIKTL